MYPNLNAELARRRITQEALANKIEMNPGTVSLKINGKSPLMLSECIRIRDALYELTVSEYIRAEDAAMRPLTIEYLFRSDD